MSDSPIRRLESDVTPLVPGPVQGEDVSEAIAPAPGVLAEFADAENLAAVEEVDSVDFELAVEQIDTEVEASVVDDAAYGDDDSSTELGEDDEGMSDRAVVDSVPNVVGVEDAISTEDSDPVSDLASPADQVEVASADAEVQQGDLITMVLDTRPAALIEAEEVLRVADAQLSEEVRRLELLKNRELRTAERLRALTDDAMAIEAAHSNLSEWIGKRSSSYAWRLVSALKGEASAVDAAEADLKNRLSRPVRTVVADLTKMRRRFARTVIASAALAVLLAFAITTLARVFPALTRWDSFANPFALSGAALAVLAIVIFAVGYVLSLSSYHRAWSAHVSVLRNERDLTTLYRQAIRQIREERQRLTFTHSQVPTYLRLMSEVIHRPWLLSDHVSRVESPESYEHGSRGDRSTAEFPRPRLDCLPRLLRLAETPAGQGGPAERELVRRSVVRVLRRNWRLAAYQSLLAEAESRLGLPERSFTPESLEREPRLREAFLEALDGGAAQLNTGRHSIRTLSRAIQMDLMEDVHPLVRRLDVDPLAGLDLSLDLLDVDDHSLIPWDAFEGEVLGLAAPWSPLTLSVNALPGELSMLSRGVGPSRLANDYVDPTVDFTATSGTAATTLELAIRIDVLRAPAAPSDFMTLYQGRAVIVDYEHGPDDSDTEEGPQY